MELPRKRKKSKASNNKTKKKRTGSINITEILENNRGDMRNLYEQFLKFNRKSDFFNSLYMQVNSLLHDNGNREANDPLLIIN